MVGWVLLDHDSGGLGLGGGKGDEAGGLGCPDGLHGLALLGLVVVVHAN